MDANGSEERQDTARRLAQVFGDSNLTQADAARAIRTSESHLSRVKRGEIGLTKAMARKLATVLPVSAHYLLFGEEVEEPAQRIAEEHQPTYDVGTGRGRVIRATVHKCQDCRSLVEIGARICPGCGAELIWPDDIEKGDAP